MNDVLETLKNHISENQVNNVTKRLKEQLRNSSVLKWYNVDAFLRSAVIHKMKQDGFIVNFEGKYVTFTKSKS